jgi:uncharacterized protein
VTVEPRVEDLLASIRKAIDDDLGSVGSTTSGNSQGTLMRGALREMRVNYDGDGPMREKADTEIATLRDRIGRSRIQSTFIAPTIPQRLPPEPAQRPARTGFSSILSGEATLPAPLLRQTIDDDSLYQNVETKDQVAENQVAYEQPYQEQVWEEAENYAAPEPEPYYPPESYAPQSALVSPQTAYATQTSFQNLADTIMARATGDRGLEDMTRDMLRGMLKTWLDDNLPDVVERLVREEIERVARRGR